MRRRRQRDDEARATRRDSRQHDRDDQDRLRPDAGDDQGGREDRGPNADAAPHTITDEGSGKAFDSGTIKGKASGSFTVDTPGTYKYICEFHPFMKGELMVTK